MLKLQRMRQALEWSDRLMLLQRQVNMRREALETTLKSLNEAWESAPRPRLPIGRITYRWNPLRTRPVP